MFGSIASPLATTRLYRISADLLCRSEVRGGEGRGGALALADNNEGR